MNPTNFINKVESDNQFEEIMRQSDKVDDAQLHGLLEENLKYNRAIYADTQKIRRYMFWRLVVSIVWMVLIVVPIILAMIYLPPQWRDFYNQYQEVMYGSQGALDLFDQLNKLK